MPSQRKSLGSRRRNSAKSGMNVFIHHTAAQFGVHATLARDANMRRMAKTGKWFGEDLAKRFNISVRTVYHLLSQANISVKWKSGRPPLSRPDNLRSASGKVFSTANKRREYIVKLFESGESFRDVKQEFPGLADVYLERFRRRALALGKKPNEN